MYGHFRGFWSTGQRVDQCSVHYKTGMKFIVSSSCEVAGNLQEKVSWLKYFSLWTIPPNPQFTILRKSSSPILQVFYSSTYPRVI